MSQHSQVNRLETNLQKIWGKNVPASLRDAPRQIAFDRVKIRNFAADHVFFFTLLQIRIESLNVTRPPHVVQLLQEVVVVRELLLQADDAVRRLLSQQPLQQTL